MCDTERTRFFRPWNCAAAAIDEDDVRCRHDEPDEDLEEQDSTSSSFDSTGCSTTIVSDESEQDDGKLGKLARRRVSDVDDDDDDDEEDDDEEDEEDDDDNHSRRSCSVSSDEMNGSLNMLSNFVRRSHERNVVDEDRGTCTDGCCANGTTAGTGGGGVGGGSGNWSDGSSAASIFYQLGYQCSGYHSNWPLQNAYLNGGGILGADYAWLPANYHSVQEAVNRLSHQDAVAKQIKKLRPKKFRCHYCNVAFSNNGQLKGHLRIHTGERPFKCDAEGCGKSFTRNEELTRHKRIHTGLRPYSCLICRKGFGRKDHLKKHTKTHDNRNVYQLTAAAVAAAASPFAAGFPFAAHHHPTAAGHLPYVYPI